MFPAQRALRSIQMSHMVQIILVGNIRCRAAPGASCAWCRFGEKNGRELVAAQMMAPVEFINIIVYA
jgi:hypothetical protein